ncbi:MAG: hypothetical protein IJW27_05310, partial [Clostridia bacterium]|nr:hypothetical protein [Clostridia bacterium]
MLLEDKKMKVMSFNTQHCLNYLSREIDYNVLAEAILAQSPDIVGLNEMRSDGEGSEWPNQTARLSELTGIPLGTLSKIMAGISDSPKLS